MKIRYILRKPISQKEVDERRDALQKVSETGKMSPELQAAADAFWKRNGKAIKGAFNILNNPKEVRKLDW